MTCHFVGLHRLSLSAPQGARATRGLGRTKCGFSASVASVLVVGCLRIGYDPGELSIQIGGAAGSVQGGAGQAAGANAKGGASSGQAAGANAKGGASSSQAGQSTSGLGNRGGIPSWSGQAGASSTNPSTAGSDATNLVGTNTGGGTAGGQPSLGSAGQSGNVGGTAGSQTSPSSGGWLGSGGTSGAAGSPCCAGAGVIGGQRANGGSGQAGQGGVGGSGSIQYATITSISSATSDGIYGLGSNIIVTVNFNEQVTLSGGSLVVALDTGAVVSIGAFGAASSVSGTYSVGRGESSSDLDSTGVTVQGGTLRSVSGFDVTTALPVATLKTSSSLVVDGKIPSVTSFLPTSGSVTTSHFVTFTLGGSDEGVGLTGWLIDESGVKPEAADPRWVATKPYTYTLSRGYGARTLYAWARDGAFNVSDQATSSSFPVDLRYAGNFTQPFEKNTAGDDMLKGGAVDYDDNLYLVGLKQNANQDWQIAKLSPGGIEDTTNWNKTIDWRGGDDSAQSVVTDSNANTYVSGWFMDGTDRKWALKKYSSSGGELWTNEWNYAAGEDAPQAMAIDSKGNIYVGGYVTNVAGDLDWWLKKYYPDGTEDTVNWNFGFDGGFGDDTILSLAVDPTDHVYVAGHVATKKAGSDWLVRKFSETGALLWTQPYDGAGGDDTAYGVAIDPSSGSVYVAGVSTSGTNIDWRIKKYDPNGNEDLTNWDKVIDHGSDDVAWGIGVDSHGNVYVGGRLQYADGDWAVARFDAAGTEASRDVVANAGFDWCRTIVVDSMDYAYGVGGMARSGTGFDWYVKKYAP